MICLCTIAGRSLASPKGGYGDGRQSEREKHQQKFYNCAKTAHLFYDQAATARVKTYQLNHVLIVVPQTEPRMIRFHKQLPSELIRSRLHVYASLEVASHLILHSSMSPYVLFFLNLDQSGQQLPPKRTQSTSRHTPAKAKPEASTLTTRVKRKSRFPQPQNSGNEIAPENDRSSPSETSSVLVPNEDAAPGQKRNPTAQPPVPKKR
jgi:hypothetical protein